VRLFLHGMRLALEYSRDWRLIYASIPQPDALGFMFSLLNSLEPQQMHTLVAINVESWGFAPCMPDKLQAYFLRRVQSIPAPHFSHLNARARYAGVINPICQFPSYLRSLSIQEPIGGLPTQWGGIETVFSTLSSLEDLTLHVGYGDDLPNASRLLEKPKIWNRLKTLNLSTDLETCMWVLTLYHFPDLQDLRLAFAKDPMNRSVRTRWIQITFNAFLAHPYSRQYHTASVSHLDSSIRNTET
jgi:hypothetical protein